jgi:hypothetical protein
LYVGTSDLVASFKVTTNLKHGAKYDQLCQLLNLNPPLRCLPAVLTDFGGIGRELYSAIIQPHFQELYEAEVEEGKLVGLGREEGEAALAPAH